MTAFEGKQGEAFTGEEAGQSTQAGMDGYAHMASRPVYVELGR